MSPFSTVKRTIQQVSSSRRLRGEVGWLITHKLIEFPIAFLTLKILTKYLGEKGFGEFNLIETAGIVVGGLLLTPMLQTYLRYFHTARALGTARSAGTFMLK